MVGCCHIADYSQQRLEHSTIRDAANRVWSCISMPCDAYLPCSAPSAEHVALQLEAEAGWICAARSDVVDRQVHKSSSTENATAPTALWQCIAQRSREEPLTNVRALPDWPEYASVYS